MRCQEINLLNEAMEWPDTSSEEEQEKINESRKLLLNKKERNDFNQYLKKIKDQILAIRPETYKFNIPRESNRENYNYLAQFKKKSEYFEMMGGDLLEGIGHILPHNLVTASQELKSLESLAGLRPQLNPEKRSSIKGLSNNLLKLTKTVRSISRSPSISSYASVSVIQASSPLEKSKIEESKNDIEQTHESHNSIDTQSLVAPSSLNAEIMSAGKKLTNDGFTSSESVSSQLDLQDKAGIIMRAACFKEEFEMKDKRRAFKIWKKKNERFLQKNKEQLKKENDANSKKVVEQSLLMKDKSIAMNRNKAIRREMFYELDAKKTVLEHAVPNAKLAKYIKNCNNIYRVKNK